MTPSPPWQQQLELALQQQATSTTRSPTTERLVQARQNYSRAQVVLNLLAQHDDDQEVQDLLVQVLHGDSNQLSSATLESLPSLLDTLAQERLATLQSFAFPSAPTATPRLSTHISSLQSTVDSLSSATETQPALLSLLTSVQPPPLPTTPPPITHLTSALQQTTSTLSAAHLKHSLLASTALSSHPSSSLISTLSDLHDKELKEIASEVKGLEETLEGYEAQMRVLEGGEGRKGKGGYRMLLGEWEELKKEEKELRGDLRRLGWREGGVA